MHFSRLPPKRCMQLLIIVQHVINFNHILYLVNIYVRYSLAQIYVRALQNYILAILCLCC